MVAVLNTLFAATLKLLLVAGGLLYAGLVLMSYRTDGLRSPLRLELADPARSVQRLMVWLGVKAVAATVGASKAFLSVLSETSAEVGVWFLRRRSAEVQAAFRSRFLV
jgi:hypothetical protein